MSPHAQRAASVVETAERPRSTARATEAAELLDFARSRGLTLARLSLRMGLDARTFHAWRAQARADAGDPTAPNERLTPSVASLNALRAVVGLHVVCPLVASAAYVSNETFLAELAKAPRVRLVDEADPTAPRAWMDGDHDEPGDPERDAPNPMRRRRARA